MKCFKGEILLDIQMFINELEKHNIKLSEQQLNQFDKYYHLLVEWNNNVNLTAITEEKEVYLKHFYDSIAASFYYDFSAPLSICDIGAGAGFPSIPLKIAFPQLEITIVDSLNKRIKFLQTLVDNLGLEKVNLVHSRAEDFGQAKDNRNKFDVVTARAVARMSVLSEYCLPLTKVKGDFIALKGSNVSEELLTAENAMKVLGGEIVENHSFMLPIEDSERSITIIKKVRQTPNKYPRKAGVPSKKPL